MEQITTQANAATPSTETANLSIEEQAAVLSSSTKQFVKATNKKTSSNKLKKLKNRTPSIPVLLPHEQNGDESSKFRSDSVDRNRKQNSFEENSKVIYRSKSLYTVADPTTPTEKSKPSRFSEPLDGKYDYQASTPNLLAKPVASVLPTKTTNSIAVDELKRRSALLNTKTYKSSTNLEALNNLHRTGTPTSSTSSNEITDYDELFDPSVVFLTSYRCRYYDHNRRIRKGKLLFSANELVFKCMGMPFVKAHLKYENIIKLTIIERHENIVDKILCIEYNHLNKFNLKFYFYNFILPVALVKMNLKSLIKKSKKYLNVDQQKTSKKNLIPGLSQIKKLFFANEKPQSKDSVESKKSGLSYQNSTLSTASSATQSILEPPVPVPRKRSKVQTNLELPLNALNKMTNGVLTEQPDTSKNSVVAKQDSKNSVKPTQETKQPQQQAPKQPQPNPVAPVQNTQNTNFSQLNNNSQVSLKVSKLESSTVRKRTALTIFLFLFMISFIMMNFFKLSELEREISSYD